MFRAGGGEIRLVARMMIASNPKLVFCVMGRVDPVLHA
jgi:hypothetical protein